MKQLVCVSSTFFIPPNTLKNSRIFLSFNLVKSYSHLSRWALVGTAVVIILYLYIWLGERLWGFWWWGFFF